MAEMAKEKEGPGQKKKLYYISAEFLIGKLLSNNMINLGIYHEVRDVLSGCGKDICEIEEVQDTFPQIGQSRNTIEISGRCKWDYQRDRLKCLKVKHENILRVPHNSWNLADGWSPQLPLS